MKDPQTVNISIGPNMYNRFQDLPYTPATVLAEFVDNALQSYRDNKEVLHKSEPNYIFTVKIDFIMDYDKKIIKQVRISDNAAGMPQKRFDKAFMPAETPENNDGLNEFGMGFKTAANWLGDRWSTETKALGENISRKVVFDLNEVTSKHLHDLPVEINEAPREEHYTRFCIRDLNKNAPSSQPKTLEKIKTSLASIYRQSLRDKEMRLVFNDEELEFHSPEILTAPFFKTPEAKPVEWKKTINVQMGKYKAVGFIALLKEMRAADNGLVLLRRGRVIEGSEEGNRLYPKVLCGNIGSPRYKRLFGELELEGFNVSFNKNEILGKENLEALMEGLKGEIHQPDFDLYAQAEGYRLDDREKKIKKIVKEHKQKSKLYHEPVKIDTRVQDDVKTQIKTTVDEKKKIEVLPHDYQEDFEVDGTKYTLQLKMINGTSTDNLFWNDVSEKDKNILICNLNVKHVFFEHFKDLKADTIAIIKSMAIARFVAYIKNEREIGSYMEYFYQYIKHIKI